MIRDMSNREFKAALKRHGMRMEGFMGYVDLGIPGHHTAVSMFNVATIGPRKKIKINLRRALAYLLAEKAKREKELDV